MYTDDIDKHTAKLEKLLEEQPVCELCGQHIQDEDWLTIPFYGCICNSCENDRDYRTYR